MGKYKFLSFIYLISLLSYSVASSIGGNVQNLYRVPLVNVRWIDIAILVIIFSFFFNFLTKKKVFKNNSFNIYACFIYLLFETFQLSRTWGFTSSDTQLSHYLCTLALFIVIDLSTYQIPSKTIINFLKNYSLIGAMVLAISNFYLLYSFLSGKAIFEDLGTRLGLEVTGSKETVYSTVLTPLVYAFGLYFLQQPIKNWKRIIYIIAVLSIYISLILTVFRGTFLALLIITLYFIFSMGLTWRSITKVLVIAALLIFVYFIFGSTLAKKGYDPIEKIKEIAQFSTDVKDPDWDKGRSISQEYALSAWKKNIWMGAGYDDLPNYGLPNNVATAHNGIITSLFHRGIIGTILFISILLSMYIHANKLWMILKTRNIEENKIIRLLILVSLIWTISFMTQEATWEKYSLCIQYLYFGLIYNVYKQKLSNNLIMKNKILKKIF